jgi:hypothetical protein
MTGRIMRRDTDLIVFDAAFSMLFGLLGIAAPAVAVIEKSWFHVFYAGGCALMVWAQVSELVKIIRRRR